MLLLILLVSTLLFPCFTPATAVGDRAIVGEKHGQRAGAATQTQSLLTAIDVVASVDDSTSQCVAIFLLRLVLSTVVGLSLVLLLMLLQRGQELEHNHSRMCCC